MFNSIVASIRAEAKALGVDEYYADLAVKAYEEGGLRNLSATDFTRSFITAVRMSEAGATAEGLLKEAQVARLDNSVRQFAGEAGRKIAANKKASVGTEGVSSNNNIRFSVSKTKAEGLKESIANLGKRGLTKNANGKKITILTDEFSVNKNIFSQKGRKASEVNARVKHIPMFADLIKQSSYVSTDSDIRNLEQDAKKGVKYIHKFKTSVDGFDIEILVRDKGNRQYLYEVKFIEKKKSPQQSMAKNSAFPAPEGDAEDGIMIPQKPPGVKSSEQKTSRRASRLGRFGVILADGLRASKDFNDRQYAAYKAAELMAKALGTDIVFHRSLRHAGKAAAGYFDPSDGSIHINIRAMRDGKHIALYTLGHETVHFIKAWSPGKYTELESFVMEKLGDRAEALMADKRAQLDEMGDLKDLTDAEADALVREEVVADSMELVLADGEVLAELQQRNRTLWEKIKTFVTSVIARVKAAYGDLSGVSKTAQVLSETVESLDQVKRLFTESVVDASEARKSGVAAEGKPSYSVSPNLESELDMVLSGKFDASKNEVYLGETSNFLTEVIGARALAHYMPASKAYAALVTREEYDKKPYYREQEHYHGIDKKDFMEILEKSETPMIAFAAAPDDKGNQRRNRIVLVTDKKILDVETGKQEYAVVVEEVDTKGLKNGRRVDANKTITIYPRSQLNWDIQQAIIDHRLLAVTKKGEHLFAGVRGSKPQAAIRKDALEKNIAYFWANVKWESEKNKKISTQEPEMPSAIRLALEKAGYIDQDGHIKSMQESGDLSTENTNNSKTNGKNSAGGDITEGPFAAAERRTGEQNADPEAQGMDMVEEVERATQADLEAENKALREDVTPCFVSCISYLVSCISYLPLNLSP